MPISLDARIRIGSLIPCCTTNNIVTINASSFSIFYFFFPHISRTPFPIPHSPVPTQSQCSTISFLLLLLSIFLTLCGCFIYLCPLPFASFGAFLIRIGQHRSLCAPPTISTHLRPTALWSPPLATRLLSLHKNKIKFPTGNSKASVTSWLYSS